MVAVNVGEGVAFGDGDSIGSDRQFSGVDGECAVWATAQGVVIVGKHRIIAGNRLCASGCAGIGGGCWRGLCVDVSNVVSKDEAAVGHAKGGVGVAIVAGGGVDGSGEGFFSNIETLLYLRCSRIGSVTRLVGVDGARACG